jgi:hypothetical protein
VQSWLVLHIINDYLIFNISNLKVNIDEVNVCKMAMINMSLVNKYLNDIAFNITNQLLNSNKCLQLPFNCSKVKTLLHQDEITNDDVSNLGLVG